MVGKKGLLEDAQAGVAAVAKKAQQVVGAVARSKVGRTAAATVLAAAAETLLEAGGPKKTSRKAATRPRGKAIAKRKAPARKLSKG